MRTNYVIYGLTDPREPDLVRYVGATRNNHQQRLRRHVTEARSGRKASLPRNQWVCELLAADVEPQLLILETGAWDAAEAGTREEHWIRLKSDEAELVNLTDGGLGVRGSIRQRRPTGSRNGMHTHPDARQTGDKHWTQRDPSNLRRGDAHPMKAGRSMPGFRPKMTAELARRLREEHAAGATTFELADRYDYAHRSVVRVIERQTWKNV